MVATLWEERGPIYCSACHLPSSPSERRGICDQTTETKVTLRCLLTVILPEISDPLCVSDSLTFRTISIRIPMGLALFIPIHAPIDIYVRFLAISALV